MNEEKICSQVEKKPEIDRLLSSLDNDISNLEDEISLLVGKLKPVLESERPKDCVNDRINGETELGENILQKSYRIECIIDAIRDLVSRIAL